MTPETEYLAKSMWEVPADEPVRENDGRRKCAERLRKAATEVLGPVEVWQPMGQFLTIVLASTITGKYCAFHAAELRTRTDEQLPGFIKDRSEQYESMQYKPAEAV